MPLLTLVPGEASDLPGDHGRSPGELWCSQSLLCGSLGSRTGYVGALGVAADRPLSGDVTH
jgi:hypothetical protein